MDIGLENGNGGLDVPNKRPSRFKAVIYPIKIFCISAKKSKTFW